MIKKLFILSAIFLACAGCQSLRSGADATCHIIPFNYVYPFHNSFFVQPGMNFTVLSEFDERHNEPAQFMRELYDMESYGVIKLDSSAYEPVYRFMPRIYFKLKSIVFREVNFENIAFSKAIYWIQMESQRLDQEGKSLLIGYYQLFIFRKYCKDCLIR